MYRISQISQFYDPFWLSKTAASVIGRIEIKHLLSSQMLKRIKFKFLQKSNRIKEKNTRIICYKQELFIALL